MKNKFTALGETRNNALIKKLKKKCEEKNKRKSVRSGRSRAAENSKGQQKRAKKDNIKNTQQKKRADKQTNGQTDTVDKYCRQIQVLQTDRQADRQTKITTKKSAKKIIETINVVIVAYEARRQVGDYVFVGCCFDTIVL